MAGSRGPPTPAAAVLRWQPEDPRSCTPAYGASSPTSPWPTRSVLKASDRAPLSPRRRQIDARRILQRGGGGVPRAWIDIAMGRELMRRPRAIRSPGSATASTLVGWADTTSPSSECTSTAGSTRAPFMTSLFRYCFGLTGHSISSSRIGQFGDAWIGGG